MCACTALSPGCEPGRALIEAYQEADRAFRACAVRSDATATELLEKMEVRRKAFYAYKDHSYHPTQADEEVKA